MIINVDHKEPRPEKHLEQVSTVLLADKRVWVRVYMLNGFGIRNHKVLLLRNQVINHDRSRLEETYPEEAMNLEYLPVLLLPLEVRLTNFLEVEICEVSEEWVTLLRTRDI